MTVFCKIIAFQQLSFLPFSVQFLGSISLIWVFVPIIYYNSSIFSQTPAPGYIDCRVITSGSSSLVPENHCFDFETNYEDAPIITIYVNVHIFNTTPAVSNAVLVQRARDFIRFSNETFANMQQNWRNGPGGVPAPYIPDAKIRVKLYSEASNPNDVNGGIWTYPTQMYDISNTSLDHPADILNSVFPRPYQSRYGSSVIDVYLINYGLYNGIQGPNTTSIGGVTYGGLSNADHLVYVTDVNAAAEKDIIENSGTNNWLRAISRTFNHEIGHVMSLRHSEDCTNPCGGIDIDIAGECGPRCPALENCYGRDGNPYPINCPGLGSVSVCTYANSRNIVSQGWLNDAITPCQWEQVFEHAFHNPRNFYRLCGTNTTLSLTASPLDDYRASQSITSTSVITGTRKVDYFSPLMRLNAGFRVALGTQFWAYPASFTCCSTGSLQSEEEASYQILKSNPNVDASNVYPNPFKDELHLNTELLGLQESNTDYSVTIFDNQGKQVYKGKISSIDNVKLNTSNWKSGSYYITIQSNEQNISKKIIKM